MWVLLLVNCPSPLVTAESFPWFPSSGSAPPSFSSFPFSLSHPHPHPLPLRTIPFNSIHSLHLILTDLLQYPNSNHTSWLPPLRSSRSLTSYVPLVSTLIIPLSNKTFQSPWPLSVAGRSSSPRLRCPVSWPSVRSTVLTSPSPVPALLVVFT